jgi:hypothetical protein
MNTQDSKVSIKFLRNELIKLNFKEEPDGYYFDAREFKARILKRPYPDLTDDHYLVIQFSLRRTFDRWANSTNFEIDYDGMDPARVNLRNSLMFIRKIVRSKVFDFNKYHYKIMVYPW